MANTVEITLKLKDLATGAAKSFTGELSGMENVVKSVGSQTQKLKTQLIDLNQGVQAIESVRNIFQQLNNAVKDLTQSYQQQLVAETQLQTVMRQRMSSTDADIQAIKDLASEQQKLGVIGDEVQLSGAQQIATFASHKKTLEQLIPAMNNLLAQQKGLNVTSQDAVTIANMMGKALQGQTSVLQRVGITFTDAEAEVLKYGNEQERAAMLAQVITNNVGEMNAALAATDAGQMKQMSNYFGDLKEKVGAVAQKLQPALTIINGLVMSSLGIARFTQAIQAMSVAMSGLSVKAIAHNAALRIHNVATSVATSLTTQYRRALNALTVTMGSAKLASAALAATLTLGLSVAIAAVTASVNYLIGRREKAKAIEREAALEQQNYISILGETRSEMSRVISELKDFNGTKEDEGRKVEELNAKYGEAFGYYKSVAQWYDTLIAKSELYCRQMVNEAKIRSLSSKAATAEIELDDLQRSAAAIPETTQYFNAATQSTHTITNPLRLDADRAVDTKRSAVDDLRSQITGLIQENTEIQRQLHQQVTTPVTEQPQTIEELATAIQHYNQELTKLKPSQQDEIQRIGKLVQGYEQQKAALEKTVNAAKGVKTKTPTPTDKDEYTPTLTEEIDSFYELDKAIAYYNDQFSKSNESQRAGIYQQITDLKSLRAEWMKPFQTTEQAYTPADIEKLNTIAELSNAIVYYEALQKNQTGEEIVNTQRTINALKAKEEAYKELLSLPAIQESSSELAGLTGQELQLKLELIGFEGVREKISALKAMLDNPLSPISPQQREEIEALIATWTRYGDSVQTAKENTLTAASALEAIGGLVGNISTMVNDQAAGWLQWGANVLRAIASAIMSISALIVAQKEQTKANTLNAVTGAASSVASIPVVGPILAIAAIGSVIAAIASIPKFASGAIAYGPTLGIFGEYAGASNNPEVVAPLSKLKSLLAPAAGGGTANVVFKIRGRDLIGFIEHMDDYDRRVR